MAQKLEEKDMSAYMSGVIVGIIVGLVLIVFLLKWTKKDGNMRCQWDERQLLIRGNGFKYSFFTVIVLLFLYSMIGFEIKGFPMDYQATGIFIILVGVAVDVVYCIWKGAYFSLNENRRRVLIVFAFLGVFNLFLGIRHLIKGDAFTDGILNGMNANLFCGLLFVIVFAALFLRMVIPEKDCDEE